MFPRKHTHPLYKRVKQDGQTVTLAVDPASGEYRPTEKVDFPVLAEVKTVEDPGQRVAALLRDKGVAGRFAWDVMAETLLYAARRIPAVSDDVVSIDRALCWGFGWELGPFQLWDAIGVAPSVARMVEDGRDVPDTVRALAGSDHPAFYLRDGLRTRVGG